MAEATSTSGTKTTTNRRAVSRHEWLEARRALLAREKAFTHERDALSAARRELPMVKIEKKYVFEGPNGKRTLADLFDGRQQLIVYHFMFDPSWDDGCRGCSFLADSFDKAVLHLPARDTSFAAISRAPVAKLESFKKRMGWQFRWLSSASTDFNYDFQVSFRPEDVAGNKAEYNYGAQPARGADMPGVSVFLRDDGDVFHTYSTYGRGLDALMNTYNYLDLTPLGRQEEELSPAGKWLRHHDKYDAV